MAPCSCSSFFNLFCAFGTWRPMRCPLCTAVGLACFPAHPAAEGKCTSPLQCWKDYPGKNLREGTCGINKKCPPAVKTEGKTLSPFGVNEGKGESYTNQGSKTPPPPPP